MLLSYISYITIYITISYILIKSANITQITHTHTYIYRKQQQDSKMNELSIKAKFHVGFGAWRDITTKICSAILFYIFDSPLRHRLTI